jgi:hypothetical protein
MRRAFYDVLFLLALLNPALADVRIEASPGGEVRKFMAFFELLRESGERVVIDGPSYSACTLALIVIPRDRLCVTRRAVLGFHAPVIVDREEEQIYRSQEVTRAVAEVYPARIRRWIQRNGGLTERPIYLRGRELAALYPSCE